MGGGAGNRVRMSNRQEQAHGRDEPAASRERALLLYLLQENEYGIGRRQRQE